MRSLLFSLLLLSTLSLTGQEVILTGILDGDLLNAGGQGGNPKVIELYVNGSLDISGYQLSRTNNNNVFTFPAGSSYADEFVYVVNPDGEDQYLAAFSGGDFGNYLLSGQILGNGNDPYQLLNPTGGVVDQTGGPIGTGNNYQDGHRYRVSNTGPDGGWVEGNWSGGNGTVDGQAVTAYAGITMFGTYTVTPPGPSVSVTAGVDADEDGTNGSFTITLSEMAAANVTVNYTLSGTATQFLDYFDSNNGSVTITAGQLS
ncbi:MAG: lamin tail domain-containing protein, partial [Bacteroidota bacterium]